MRENVPSWEALNSWYVLCRLAANEGHVFRVFERNGMISSQSRSAQSCRQSFFSNGSVNRFENVSERGRPARHFVAATFADLLYSGSKSRGRTERIPGNGARSSSFPEELFTSGWTQSAPPISARLGLGRVQAGTTRREGWPDMAEAITSILICN